MSPEGLAIIGPLGLAALEESGWAVQSIGGLTLGADPVTYAISYASALAGRPLRAFSVRKEAKTYATGKRIEGSYSADDRVAIIEDVITTGGSALRAAEVVRAEGGHIAGILALIDREEGGRDAIEAAGYPVLALTTAAQVLGAMSSV